MSAEVWLAISPITDKLGEHSKWAGMMELAYAVRKFDPWYSSKNSELLKKYGGVIKTRVLVETEVLYIEFPDGESLFMFELSIDDEWYIGMRRKMRGLDNGC